MRNKVSRRKFMAGIGAGVGATAAVSMAAGCSSSNHFTPGNPITTTPTSNNITDLEILNFALSLEFLGAEYYLNGLTGTGVPASIAGSGAGTVTGASQVQGLAGNFYGDLIANFAQDELSHITALQAAITSLGGTPVARPQINFGAFATIATAAGVANGSTFNPFSSLTNFILGAFTFEDVDTSAYTGAAPLIQSSAVLNAAAGIQAVEAYHAGIIRTLIVGFDAVTNGNSLTTIANQISAFRASLGGGNETPLSPTSIVNANASAVGYARSTDQVLHIVYGTAGGAGASKGGFFPAGLTGTITVTGS